jgi:hypothetical protein
MVHHLRHAKGHGVRVLPFDDTLEGLTANVRAVLTDWLTTAPRRPDTARLLAGYTGPALAMQLGGLLDSLVEARG